MFLKKQEKQQDTVMFEDLFVSFRAYTQQMSATEWKRNAIILSAVSVVLIVASSILYAMNMNEWLCTLVGSPAGILLFLVGLSFVYNSEDRNWKLFQYRSSRSFSMRLKAVALFFVILILVFVPLNSFIPYGVGGTVVVLSVLTAFTVGRRTQYEVELAAEGVPDPRDLASDDEEVVSEVVKPDLTKEVSGEIK